MGDIGDPYAELVDLRTYLSMQEDDRFDSSLTQALESVSEEIEQFCNRQFNKTTSATAREFPILVSNYVMVDDFFTTIGLVIESSVGGVSYDTTWTAADYELHPLNGVVSGQTGWPYNKIKMRAGGSKTFRTGGRLRVTAQWGWNAVPAPVKQACLILAGATFQLKDSPFGVAGSDQWGTIRVKDNLMAQNKLSRYIVDRILVG
jgi:hypothetical protein